MNRRVLIVTESCPPFNDIAAQRFGTLAPKMAAHGWEPWILTTEGDGPLPLSIPASQVVRISPHPRQGQFGLPATSSWWRATAKSVLRTVLRGTGFRLNTFYPANGRWTREVFQSEASSIPIPRCDAVIGSFSPTAALVIAKRFAERWNVPWIADFRDLAAMKPDRANAVSRWADGWHERRLVQSASRLTSVSPTLKNLLESSHGLPTDVIYNGWVTRGRTRSQCEDGSLPPHYLHYAGVLIAHRLPSFRLIFEAMKRHAGLHFVLRSLGPPALERRLRSFAESTAVVDRIRLLPPCDPDRLAVEAANAVANVVTEDLDRSHIAGRGTLTGKLLKLIAGGPPVLAVARADSDIGPILVETQKGRLCHTVREIDEFLSAAPAAYPGCEPAIERYSMATQAASLCGALDAAGVKIEGRRAQTAL